MACAGDGREVLILYRNCKGEVAWRLVIPMGMQFGRTDHHPQAQWLMQAWDCDKKEHRSFAHSDILYRARRQLNTIERDVIMKFALQAREVEDRHDSP